VIKLILATLLLVTFTTAAGDFNSYYPQELGKFLQTDTTIDQDELKTFLFNVLDGTHQEVSGSHDVLGCASGKGKCYSQNVLGYSGARKVLFGKIHLEKDAEGYFIKDVYCNKELRERQTRMGPGRIPNSNILNCEHTWPQSKFTGRFAKEMQKSDLHHLYPTDSHANSVRGNYPFEDLDNGLPVDEDCTASRSINGRSFEPPTEHKGNVARSLFYFSVRYQIKIDRQHEEILKRWHNEDPVDASERDRNETIFQVQNNRNPFIDMPELVDVIKDF